MKIKRYIMRTFQEYLDKIRPEVNAHIKFIAEDKISDPDIIPVLLKGKRMRAGLLLLVFDALPDRGKDISRALDLACAVELAHSASLILDDMLDEDEERRGQPAAHITRGHKRAILDVIDVLSLPYDIAAQYGEMYVHMLAETQREMVSGVVKELFHAPDLPAAELYDAVITRKTGRLFSLAAMWGCLAARPGGLNPLSSEIHSYRVETASFAEYGLGCGKAMQIADDIADIKKAIEGKKIGMPGSEILLLGCTNVGWLVKETCGDFKSVSQQLSRIEQIWSYDGVQKTISSILDKEITRSRMIISSIDVPYIYREILLNVPSGIANMLLSE